jgi:hypothetical protein
MAPKLFTAKIIWMITEVLVLIAALGGIFIKGLYEDLFQRDFLPGAVAQDLISVFLTVFLFWLIANTKEVDIKKQVIIIGIIGSQCYLYGILSIERVYNSFYIIYLAIFAASFWSMIYGLAGFRSRNFVNLRLREGILKITAVSSIAIAVIFMVLWIVALIPLMRDHTRIEYLYSIYILDLCFVMPAFVITAIMSFKKMALGILMAPAIMILGFFVIFPLGLNELAKPAFGMAISYGPMVISFLFSIFMLSLAYIQLRFIHID